MSRFQCFRPRSGFLHPSMESSPDPFAHHAAIGEAAVVLSFTLVGARADGCHTSTHHSTDIKPSNILLGLSSHNPELHEVDWIQHCFDKIPIPTGMAHPDRDHVQSKAVYNVHASQR